MVEEKFLFYNEVDCKEADHLKHPTSLVICIISSSQIIDVGPLLGESLFNK